MSNEKLAQSPDLWQSLLKISQPLKHAVFLSFFLNMLVLAPTWYMLQVYDRVLSSKNYHTLLMLTVLVFFLYLIMEVLDWIRARIMFNASKIFCEDIKLRIFNAVFKSKLKNSNDLTNLVFSDMQTLQDAIASPGLMMLMDLPFAILILILIYLINVAMGAFATVGLILLCGLAIYNRQVVQPPLTAAGKSANEAMSYANSVIKNSQVIESMGMFKFVHQRWSEKQLKFLQLQATASDSAGINSSLSKLIQTMQGSLLLGLGCWLTLNGDVFLGGGMMLVGSILGGRVLAPLVGIISYWRSLGNAIDSFKRINELLKLYPEKPATMALPAPLGNLSVESVVAGAPNNQAPIIKGINFKLTAGQSLAIIGPSASGKTSLARLITGIWPAMNGKVRLDGADLYQWDKDQLGPYVGYLPQDIELFDGSLAENIARFGDVDIEKVKEAIRVVGLQEFVEGLEHGLDSQLGEEGAFLSGGQRQRVAFARAIYGMPKFVVLDEPNSSLDEAGDIALYSALNYLKANGTTVVVITHRSQILSMMDMIMILVEGQIKSFGPRDEVLAILNPTNQNNNRLEKSVDGPA
jgi:ATP-binding cassette subfamily C exporter for protease/lipase